jgi:subtilase family serine protease
MRAWKLLLSLLASTLCFAQQPDRITAPINSAQMVALTGNVHSLAQPRFDLGLADSSKVLYGVTLAFRPSAAQQADLNKLLAEQQDRSSPNYHKWLTPAQFADRFGMTQNDVNRVVAWLEAQGFTVTSIANSRNQISFDGTVAQVDTAFRTEMHNYLVDGEIHLANATNPSVPAALAGLVLAVGNLHNFSPKPRAILRSKPSIGATPHFTDPAGDHFLAPGDFATIYDLPAGLNGTSQTIAVIGQSTVNANDLANFRSAAGLAAKVPQYILYPTNSTATRCPGDEGESDLDLEWSNGVAQNANVIFVYAGLGSGDTCTSRNNSVWNALQQAVDNNYAPIISISYGACEAVNGEAFDDEVQGWAQEANMQGQTIMASSGDAGAADCDPTNSTLATGGLAVDIPGAIPEVTAMGGNEFDGDAEATVTGGNANPTTYWKGTTGGNITLSSAISYIPEMAWNDTAENSGLLASGGGASIYFAKPTWQTGTGVPADGARDVPDLALNASPYHDPYIICSEDGQDGTVVSTCTNGFVNADGEIFLAGGTSCAAPTFSGILAVLNQSLGTPGLGNINPTLYSLVVSSPTAFHDVTTGNNIVPCEAGTTDCPASTPHQYGYSAGVGYDQVTGLGSVDASKLLTAWKASIAPDFQLTASALSPSPVSAGQSTSSTLTIAPVAGSVGTVVNFAPSNCTGLPTGATCSFSPASVTFDGTDDATTTVTISTLANMAASGPTTITITPTNSSGTTTTVSLTVTATTETFTLATQNNATTFPVTVGATAAVAVSVNSTTGFIVGSGTAETTALPLTYTCIGSPSLTAAEISCQISPGGTQPTNAPAITVNLGTVAPTSQLRRPFGGGIFYAVLLPGLFGIVFAAGSRTRGVRLLSLIVVLGFSTLWLGACGGSGGGGSTTPTNPGSTPGTYTVTINATTGGANPVTSSLAFTLTVTQ